MPLAYSIVGAADADNAFVTRVKAALENAAAAINSEAVGTANHVPRLALVGKVINDPVSWAQRFAPAVASVAPVLNATSLAGATDTDIQTGVNALWDEFALRTG